jgi:predicted acylesterase/phospholipase RssA
MASDTAALAGRSRYTVLAVDGGGIRGIVPARVLQEIERRTRRPTCELFDLVAGTSTGGLVALGLSAPAIGGATSPAYTASDLVALYRDHGGEIFHRPAWRRATTLGGLVGARYPARALEELLEARFGGTMISAALTELVIPSYDLSRPGPFFFKRRYPRQDEAWDVPMALAARATSAAPTYFAPAPLEPFADEPPYALVDGGVFANDPAVSAYAEALDLWGADVEIHVVSVGTGQPPQTPARGGRIPVPYREARRWGLARWARPLVDVVFDGIADAAEYQMKRLCHHGDDAHPRYHRLQSPLPTADHALDDASPGNVRRLLDDALALLHEEDERLDALCATLTDVAADRDAQRLLAAAQAANGRPGPSARRSPNVASSAANAAGQSAVPASRRMMASTSSGGSAGR